MKKSKKVISLFLAVCMMLGCIPAFNAVADAENVYISVSFDGEYINDKNGEAAAYMPVSLSQLETVDLNEYGLSEYLYDADNDGEYDITALHLYIYTHEKLLGLNFEDVSVSGGAGSIFFESGLFGFSDCNMQYYLNGEYPAIDGWGVTADNMTLTDGDFIDVAAYTSWSFFSDSMSGFHYFADADGNITHEYSAKEGEAFEINLVRTSSFMGSEATLEYENGYSVYYGKSMDGEMTEITTDGGSASLSLEEGTWYIRCRGAYGAENPTDIVSSPAYARITVSGGEEAELNADTVLSSALAQLAQTVVKPQFGTSAGEWSVLCLARGGYYAKDSTYFADYYDGIVETVNTKAASVSPANGALHKSKSTDNSRLIIALASIGKSAVSVGDWNLITPYNDFAWIKNQGINGVIWALLALDSNSYKTEDESIRKQCVDYILNAQLEDGGWTLAGSSADSDITAMAVQALRPYSDIEEAAAAVDAAFSCLSDIQLENGGFATSGAETAESAAQVVTACTAWGIDPDTDSRFIKNGKSTVDALLAHFDEEEAMFKHISGGDVNNIATDQGCYALIAYDRFLKGENSLYDMSDVVFDENSNEMTAFFSMPSNVSCGEDFNAAVSISRWDNNAGYKLIDLIVNVPEGLTVTGVTALSRLSGGDISYNLEEESRALRIVYFDANENSDICISGEDFPAELFSIGFTAENSAGGKCLGVSIGGMSVKLSSDAYDESAMIIVNTENAYENVNVVRGFSVSAACLYQGDGEDLIPADKKAIVVSVTGISQGAKLTYNDGTTAAEFRYSPEITEKTGVAAYVALVDADCATENFANTSYYSVSSANSITITFGDGNADGVINAQDALMAVDAWLRKGEALTDDDILVLNVNGDGRINTFDALGIVEAFVNSSPCGVVIKAVNLGV